MYLLDIVNSLKFMDTSRPVFKVWGNIYVAALLSLVWSYQTDGKTKATGKNFVIIMNWWGKESTFFVTPYAESLFFSMGKKSIKIFFLLLKISIVSILFGDSIMTICVLIVVCLMVFNATFKNISVYKKLQVSEKNMKKASTLL
jgi:hypothetical protein